MKFKIYKVELFQSDFYIVNNDRGKPKREKEHNYIPFSENFITLTFVSIYSYYFLNKSHQNTLLEFLYFFFSVFKVFDEIYTIFHVQS